MKRIYLIILLSAMTLSSMAQSVGEVFYIYRNDGQFNAFYCDDVQSIEYSYDGIDGVTYSEIVTQVVKTKDEVYKIPLASIDSVAFKVNDIVVSKDYQFVDEDGYDIISADIDNGQSVLRFHGDVPAIEEGKVMTIIGDDIAEIIRVQSIEVLGKDVTLLTEPASLGEVFANGSFTLSTEDGNNTNRASAVGHNIFYPTEIIMYDENNQRHNFKRSATNRVSFEKNIYKFKMDYTGYEFYKNDYVRLYWEKYVAEFNLDLVLSFNFNSLREGKDKWRKGKLEMQKGVIRGTLTNDCMLRFDANAQKEEELEEIMLKRNIHKPIIAKFVVAGVPVVVIMNTHLYGHGYYNAEGSFSAYTGFATSTTAEIGYSWSQASGIKPYSTFNPSLTFHHPTIEGKAHLDYKAGVYPSITFSLYGLVGPTFNIKPYLRNTLDIGLYDDLISNDIGDYYGATFNQLVGYDASVGMSFLSPLGRDPFVLSPSWNVIEKVLYESPYKIKTDSQRDRLLFT